MSDAPRPDDSLGHPRLRDKVAIVTGSASGIGRGTALRLAREGAAVAVADVDASGASRVAEEIASAGGRAVAVTVDVAEEASVAGMIAATLEAFGRLDILHNNAAAMGGQNPGMDHDILELDVATWDRAMAVNLRGVMLGCKHGIPPMLESGGGSIINTSSGAALAGGLTTPAYATSKGGLNTFTQYVAAQFGKRGIRCNAILPGMITTPTAERALGAEQIQMILDHHLTPRTGTPEDIAAMVAFLASDESAYVTGQLIRVDGGITSHLPTYADTRRMLGEP